MTLGEKIQQLRKNKGLSQEQLADALQVSRQSISKWETDQSTPELDKILAISDFFSVSTDELLKDHVVGNIPVSPVPLKKGKWHFDFNRGLGYLKSHMNNKVLFLIFSLACIIAMGTCIIVNYSIDNQITWAIYPILSITFGWLVVLPLIFKKYIFSLFLISLTVIPFLYFLDKAIPGPFWFRNFGLPVAIMGIIYMWVAFLVFRYLKISVWYKAAIVVFLAGVVISPLTDHFLNNFLGTGPSYFQLITNIFSGVVISAILIILGYLKRKPKSTEKTE